MMRRPQAVEAPEQLDHLILLHAQLEPVVPD
jgi:hypothetical protein